MGGGRQCLEQGPRVSRAQVSPMIVCDTTKFCFRTIKSGHKSILLLDLFYVEAFLLFQTILSYMQSCTQILGVLNCQDKVI